MGTAKSSKTPYLTREEIERRAADILREHGLYSVPVDPVTLANRQGIKVHNAKFSEEGISGILAKRGGSVTMLIHQSEHPNRKRFSIAHELGHHFLHLLEDGEIIDTDVDMFRFELVEGEDEEQRELRRREIQANIFAAALLMPAVLVEEAYRGGTKDLAELAHLFRVSEEAMGYRLGQLGLE